MSEGPKRSLADLEKIFDAIGREYSGRHANEAGFLEVLAIADAERKDGGEFSTDVHLALCTFLSVAPFSFGRPSQTIAGWLLIEELMKERRLRREMEKRFCELERS